MATTVPGSKTSKLDFDKLGGHAAGICYMADTFQAILNEDVRETEKRIKRTQVTGHHSVYDHPTIMLYLDQVPKLLVMLLNNEKMYTTSEKSARYTKMAMSGLEKKLYYKWLDIFQQQITKVYGNFYNKAQIEKLAQENSRYLISVMTPTSLAYTVSYRQLNYIYGWIKQMISQDKSELANLLRPSLIKFAKELEKTGYIEPNLVTDNKNRSFSLFTQKLNRVEYFGDVYCTTYKGSLAQLAQAHRHRTLNYTITLLPKKEFYIPPIIADNKELVSEWLEDMNKVGDLYPQGLLVSINERGTYENFILKTKERLCTYAQLEICQQTHKTLLKYAQVLKQSNHVLVTDIEKYTKGARCTSGDYNCSNDCHFKAGKLLDRLI